ncbi:uncharacterized protein LOC112508956 [Cynara cardunculus var. scolymus]|uniref:uncharacterized protein LOC112508956 n=1 Tax=Cynara cardunculus var. scolymus TaxID=59895 RepID=UPI000D62A24E|nr:uncharacterized protein LOC112508956 [Cynara cardunculus var. scolymus]
MNLKAWQSLVFQENQQLNCMIEDILINSSNMFIGDQPLRARKIYHDKQCEIGEARLMEDYFVDNSTYDDAIYRRRYQMRRSLFRCIVDVVIANNDYFQQRPDAIGSQSLSPLQKCTGVMRVLAYGTSIDAIDEYLRMSGYTTRDALMNLVDGVILCFGQAPQVSYIVNGRENNRAYYLTYYIYPSWTTFFKLITFPTKKIYKLFAQCQESCRKDVERAFGVLQDRFAFIRHPCPVWDKDNIGRIMIACIILHNMIVKNELDAYLHYYNPTEFLNNMPTNRQPESYTEDDGQPSTFSTEFELEI